MEVLITKRKVFGIGWAKTGTTTLGRCLRILGYKHMSQRLDLVSAYASRDMPQLCEIVAEADSFEDWPWILLFRELDRAFPESSFILTTRDSQRWLTSYRNMLAKQGPAKPRMTEMRRVLYDLDFPDVTDEDLLRRYKRHNEEVLHHFTDRPESLLVVDWEKKHGWAELCGFLQTDCPNVEFPHENRGHYTQSDAVSP